MQQAKRVKVVSTGGSGQAMPVHITNPEDLPGGGGGSGATSTSQLTVSDPTSESISGTATKQNIVNQENKSKETNQDSRITTIENRLKDLTVTLAGYKPSGVPVAPGNPIHIGANPIETTFYNPDALDFDLNDDTVFLVKSNGELNVSFTYVLQAGQIDITLQVETSPGVWANVQNGVFTANGSSFNFAPVNVVEINDTILTRKYRILLTGNQSPTTNVEATCYIKLITSNIVMVTGDINDTNVNSTIPLPVIGTNAGDSQLTINQAIDTYLSSVPTITDVNEAILMKNLEGYTIGAPIPINETNTILNALENLQAQIDKINGVIGDTFNIDLANPVEVTGVTYANNTLTFTNESNGNEYVLSGTTTNKISIQSGVSTKITLNGVDMTDLSNLIAISTGASLEVEVKNGTMNILTCTATATTANSTPINVPLGASLFMYGTGSLKVTGGSHNSGIGTGNTNDSGYIYIKDTTIEAIGGNYSPGIGAPILATNDVIKISGSAVITGSGGFNSALIGGGSTGGGGKIIISDSVSVIGYSGGPDGGAAIGKGLNGPECALSIGNKTRISIAAYVYGAFKDDDTNNDIADTNIVNIQLDTALSTTLERIVRVKDLNGVSINVSDIVVPKNYKFIGCTTPGYSGEVTIEVYDETGTILLGTIVESDDTKVNTKNDFSLTNVKFVSTLRRDKEGKYGIYK